MEAKRRLIMEIVELWSTWGLSGLSFMFDGEIKFGHNMKLLFISSIALSPSITTALPKDIPNHLFHRWKTAATPAMPVPPHRPKPRHTVDQPQKRKPRFGGALHGHEAMTSVSGNTVFRSIKLSDEDEARWRSHRKDRSNSVERVLSTF